MVNPKGEPVNTSRVWFIYFIDYIIFIILMVVLLDEVFQQLQSKVLWEWVQLSDEK